MYILLESFANYSVDMYAVLPLLLAPDKSKLWVFLTQDYFMKNYRDVSNFQQVGILDLIIIHQC